LGREAGEDSRATSCVSLCPRSKPVIARVGPNGNRARSAVRLRRGQTTKVSRSQEDVPSRIAQPTRENERGRGTASVGCLMWLGWNPSLSGDFRPVASGFRAPVESVLLNLVEELAAADPEQTSGARAVPLLLFKGLADHAPLGLGEDLLQPHCGRR